MKCGCGRGVGEQSAEWGTGDKMRCRAGLVRFTGCILWLCGAAMEQALGQTLDGHLREVSLSPTTSLSLSLSLYHLNTITLTLLAVPQVANFLTAGTTCQPLWALLPLAVLGWGRISR